MKSSLISQIFLKRSLVFPILLFSLFLCIEHWGRLSYLSLLFFGTLHSNGYIFPFLLCISLLFFSQLFDPCLCWRLLDTYGQVWVSHLWGHYSFLLGPREHKVLFVPSKCLFPQSCVSSGGSMEGLIVTSSKRAYTIPRSTTPPEPLPLQSPLLTHISTWDAQTVLSQSLWGLCVLVHTMFVWVLWASLAGMAFDSRYNFTPPTVLLWLLLCPWMWDISSKSLQCHAATTPLLEYTLSFFSEKRFWG